MTTFTGQPKTCFKPGASRRGLLVCRTPSEVCKLCKCLVKCLELFQHLSDNTHTKLKISENERLSGMGDKSKILK